MEPVTDKSYRWRISPELKIELIGTSTKEREVIYGNGND